MLWRPVFKGHATMGEINTTWSFNDLLKYDELQDFFDDLEEERNTKDNND